VDLAALSKVHGDFYAPAFSVRVGGGDLIQRYNIGVTQAEADLSLGAAGRFTFTVVNAYSIEKHAFVTGSGRDLFEVLTFGAEVEIRMGYGDLAETERIITGIVTEMTTSFPDQGTPELSIAGYDHGFLMTTGKNTRSWKQRRDSEAVLEIAGFHNLTPDIEPTKEQHPQIEQSQESDFEFLKKLAERNHYEFYVRDRTLRFGKPRDKGDGQVKLQWGAGLISFRPQANLAGQIAGVEVHGWDPKQKKPIVGKALAGDESGRDTGRNSAGDRLKTIAKDANRQPLLRIRQPVFTQAEADSRAKAALSQRAKQFLTAEGESIGLPEIRPDMNVTLDNLGTPFSKTYYVQQTTHRVDGSGYRTKFKVKETTL